MDTCLFVSCQQLAKNINTTLMSVQLKESTSNLEIAKPDVALVRTVGFVCLQRLQTSTFDTLHGICLICKKIKMHKQEDVV